MFLRIGISIAVAVFTLASAWNNWEHLRGYGYGIIAALLAAEIMKPMLPVAMLHHVENESPTKAVATIMAWALIVVFSVNNTFSNTYASHATVAKKAGIINASETRPEHIILGDMAAILTCKDLDKQREEQTRDAKGRQRTIKIAYKEADTDCQQTAAARKLALTAELTTQKERKTSGQDATLDRNAVTDAQITVANMLGYAPKRFEMVVYVALLMTALIEICSAFGGLCIPTKKAKDAKR
jgi:hypothetical protein